MILMKADAEFVEIHRIADRLEPKLRREFLAAFDKMRKSIPVNQITELIESESLLELSKLIAGLNIPNPAAIEALLVSGAIESGAATAARLVGTPTTVTEVGLVQSFTIKNPAVERWAASHVGEMITGINVETRKAIQEIVATGFREGIPPRTSAKQIERVVGLTDRQAKQVQRFHQGLTDTGTPLKRADELADRMTDRLVKRRAKTIARNESIDAANQGQLDAWRKAMDDGLLPPTTRRVWTATIDDRTCTICSVLDGQTIEFNGMFTTSVEAVDFTDHGDSFTVHSTRPLKEPITTERPRAHVNCRCSMSLVFD